MSRANHPLAGVSGAIYYLGLACLFTHELDAVTHSEWRLILFLRSWPDDKASPWFVALHVPLFFAILWLSHFPREGVRRATRVVVAAFLVVHAVLHFSLASNPRYEFRGTLSRSLIVSAAACGLAYLLAKLGKWRDAAPSALDRGRSSS
jgi:hypothetical protein